jgi:hypothetical protein
MADKKPQPLRLAATVTKTIEVLRAHMSEEQHERARVDLHNRGLALSETLARLDTRQSAEYRPVPLSCFVVVGPGVWARAETLHEAVASAIDRLVRGDKRKKREPIPLHVFASDQHLEVEVFDYVRVRAKLDAALVNFVLNA